MALAALIVGALAFSAAGCRSASKANITLRKENQKLHGEVTELKRAREADAASIRALQGNTATQPTLPAERLEQLFTTHGLRIGKLTAGFDTDADKPGDELLKVYVVPTDRTGDLLKAAGSFVVELFDLAGKDEVRIGHWEFPADQAASMWYGQVLSYGYVLPCPWQTVPANGDLTLKVSFTDTLTGRTFTAQRQITINPPHAS